MFNLSNLVNLLYKVKPYKTINTQQKQQFHAIQPAVNWMNAYLPYQRRYTFFPVSLT